MSVLLDTDHCVAVLRGRMDVGHRVTADMELFTTSITVGELAYGAGMSSDEHGNLAAARTLLEGLTVIGFDSAAAFVYGSLKASLRRKGLLIGEPDLQIAGVAIAYGLTLATHNRRHFDRIPGLQVTDWLA